MYSKNNRSLQGVSRRSGQQTPQSQKGGSSKKYGATFDSYTKSTAVYSGQKLDVQKRYKKITEELSDDDELDFDNKPYNKKIESVQQSRDDYMTGGLTSNNLNINYEPKQVQFSDKGGKPGRYTVGARFNYEDKISSSSPFELAADARSNNTSYKKRYSEVQ